MAMERLIVGIFAEKFVCTKFVLKRIYIFQQKKIKDFLVKDNKGAEYSAFITKADVYEPSLLGSPEE